MAQQILVLGGTNFIGRDMVKRLREFSEAETYLVQQAAGGT